MSDFARMVANVDLDRQHDKIVQKVSPSSIEKFNACARQWVFAYIFGLKTPPSDGQKEGTDIHNVVDHYYATGEWKESKWKALAQEAVKHLAPRGIARHEEWLSAPTYVGGPKFEGRFDNVDPRLLLREIHGRTVFARAAHDMKSCKDYRFNKTPQELSENVQLLSYGYALLHHDDPDYLTDEHVLLRHVYMKKTGAAHATHVDALVTREHLVERWKKTLTTIKEMQDVNGSLPRRETAIAQVTPNLDECDKYLGCAYKSFCHGTVGVSFSFEEPKKEERRNMGIFDEMQRQATQPTNGAAAPQGIFQQPQAPAPQQQPLPPVQPPAPPTTQACTTCKGTKWMPNPDGRVGSFVACTACQQTGVQLIQPPDQASREFRGDLQQQLQQSVQQTAPQPQQQIAPQPQQQTVAPFVPPAAPPPAAPYPLAAPFVPPALQQPQPVPMDPRAAEIFAKAKAEQEQQQQAAPKEKKTRAKKSAATATETAREGIAIYVDCLPEKGPDQGEGIDFQEWIAPIAERLAQAKGVADWRCIPYSADGDLAVAMREQIQKSGLPPVVLVSGNHRARAPFLEVAKFFASSVTVAVSR